MLAAMTELRGAHVIITGGSEGIGAAFAKAAYDAGARVSLIARREAPLVQAARDIGPGVAWQCADVTDSQALEAAIEQLCRVSGPCEVLVCCAGIALPGRFLEVPAGEFEQQWGLNVGGAVNAARAVLPAMVARTKGHVVFVSSTAGVIGVPGYTGYAASKFGIRGMADALRYEVAPKGVNISVLFPPDTQTPGFEAENLRKPEETMAVSGSIKPVPAQRVADALLKGIAANKRNVTADPTTALLLRFGGLLEPALHWQFARTVRKALR